MAQGIVGIVVASADGSVTLEAQETTNTVFL